MQVLNDAIGAKPIEDLLKGALNTPQNQFLSHFEYINQTCSKSLVLGLLFGLLLHLNRNLSTDMTLLVRMLVFINKFPRDFDGKIFHLYENGQSRVQNKNQFDGVCILALKPYFQAKFKMAAMKSQSYHIFINYFNRDKIISPNHLFLVSKNAKKQTIHLFDITIMQNSKWPSWNH